MIPGPRALIFDVDGTLAETEDIHRTSFNAAFKGSGLDWHWDNATYEALLKTTGGKERINRFIEDQKLAKLPEDVIARLHLAKNEIYAETLARGGLVLRPGIERLIRLAKDSGLKLGIATTTSRSNLLALLQCCFGHEGAAVFDVLVCGEDVKRKKPDPQVYTLCMSQLAELPEFTVAFEDSGVGLKAALAAGIRTVVTPSAYTRSDSFVGATVVLPDLVDFTL
jgi:HAD superfamily hydrolase (TIGR01509 family)